LIGRQLSILENSSDASRRKAAVLVLIGGVAPITGPGDLDRSDFANDKITHRLSAIILHETDGEVQRELARFAGEASQKTLVPALEEALARAASEPARREIIRTLSQFQDVKMMPHLRDYFNGSDPQGLDLALFGFASIRNDETTALLIKGLEHHGSNIGMYYATNALERRGAKEAIPELKRILAIKAKYKAEQDFDLLPAVGTLMALDPKYGNDMLRHGDDFSLKAFANVLAISQTGGWSIARLQQTAVDDKQPLRVRRNALIALRLGYYWNQNYLARLSGSESSFFAFLRNTISNPKENGSIRDECRRIVALKG
jgi:hypothetical protein